MQIELKDDRRELVRRGVRVVVLLSTVEHPATVEEMQGPIVASDLAEATAGIVMNVDLIHSDPSAHILKLDAIRKLTELRSLAQKGN